MKPATKMKRGFASMDPERVKAIASQGGQAAHRKGNAHQWTPDEARRAGKLGGAASQGGKGKDYKKEKL